MNTVALTFDYIVVLHSVLRYRAPTRPCILSSSNAQVQLILEKAILRFFIDLNTILSAKNPKAIVVYSLMVLYNEVIIY